MSEPSRLMRRSTIALVVAVAVVGGIFGIVPVRSQAPRLEATAAPAPVSEDDPWDSVWDSAPSRRIPLSAQELVPPFGGGAVESLTVRALHADERLYVLLEWADDQVDDAVDQTTLFADAAALQFPAVDGTNPPYTMGSTDLPVSIWQWKAVWQKDVDEGFVGSAYPNTAVDEYPGESESIYNPARHVGNQLSDPEHDGPIENLVAQGFGTLTPASDQDVAGAGRWEDGTWRAVFARDFESSSGPTFAVDESTLLAFAIWDGAAGDRNGQKAIAQFIELDITGDAAAPLPGPGPSGESDGGGGIWWTILFVLGGFAVLVFLAVGGRVAWLILEEARGRE